MTEHPPGLPTEGDRRRRWWVALAWSTLVLALLHSIALAVMAPVLPEDDAYITYRYARNIVSGEGPVFNSGERVLGTTSPLHAASLALVGALVGVAEIPSVAVRGNVLILAITALLAVILLLRLGVDARLAPLAGAWLLLSPRTLGVALGGTDTWLYVCLAMGALIAASSRRWTPAALLTAGAILTRPEGIVLGFALVIGWWLAGRPRGVRPLLAGGVPLLVWTTFAFWYYGSPIPQSLRAKLAPLYVTPPWLATRLELSEIAGLVFGQSNGFGWRVLAATILAGAVVVVALVDQRPQPRERRVIAGFALLSIVFYAAGNPMWNSWYGPVVTVPCFLVFVLAVDGVLPWLASRRLGLLACVAMAVPVLALMGGTVSTMVAGYWPGHAFGVYSPFRLRILPYASAGQWLERVAPPGASVASPEVGALGFAYENGPVEDGCGLVSPSAQQFLPVVTPACQLGGALAPAFIRQIVPAFVVSFPNYSDALRADPWFLSHYVPIATFTVPGRDYPGYRLAVYAAADALGR